MITDIRHLRLVEAIATTGNLTTAAQQLHLTPSAVSQQLRELEERMGGVLFHRNWRSMEPTAAGARLVEVARHTLPRLMEAEDEARALLTGTEGTIRFATACYHSYRWLPRLLEAYAATWPGMVVSIVPNAAEAPYEALRNRAIDVALVVGQRARDTGRRDLTLFEDEIVAVVGRGHPWFDEHSVSPVAFAGQHYYGDPAFLEPGRPLGKALAAAGAFPERVTPLPHPTGAPLEMARAGLGITVMALWAAEPSLQTGDLRAVRITPEGLWIPWVVSVRDEIIEPAMHAFLAAMAMHHPRAGQVGVASAPSGIE